RVGEKDVFAPVYPGPEPRRVPVRMVRPAQPRGRVVPERMSHLVDHAVAGLEAEKEEQTDAEDQPGGGGGGQETAWRLDYGAGVENELAGSGLGWGVARGNRVVWAIARPGVRELSA